MQVALDVWRGALVDTVNYKTDKAMVKFGIDDSFMRTVTVGALWIGLPPEVGILEHNGQKFVRYSEEFPPPKDVVQVKTWNLRQADAYLGSFARREALRYESVFAKPSKK